MAPDRAPEADGAPPLKRARATQKDEEDDIQDAEYWAERARDAERAAPVRRDLYMDTIDRRVLDFDFEKVCSVSLSKVNIYVCLVCGKYFQGRGKQTHAYFHAIDESHHVFLNMESGRVYVLPDNYEVDDASLSDIQYQLRLPFSEQQIARLDAPDAPNARDLWGKPYRPGFVGLNNLGRSDAMNAVLQALVHVPPLRDYFLRGGSPSHQRTDVQHEPLAQSTELVRRFGMLVRRMWNPRAFKGQVSPHEFLQEVAQASHGRLRLTEATDPVDFLGWLLNRLHRDLVGASHVRDARSVITECFQGALRLESQKVIVRTGLEDEASTDKLDHDGRLARGQEDEHGHAKFNIDKAIKVDQVPFLLLALDLPPLPVFQDVVAENIIPQVPIAQVLSKYDGITIQEAQGLIKRHQLTRLPPYLLLHFRRFTRNRFVEERNKTLVQFPTRGLDLQPYVEGPTVQGSNIYHLLANITHDATAGTVRDDSVWRSQVHTADGHWFQMQDLHVDEVNPQMLFLGESYVQIWERAGAADDMRSRIDSLPLPRRRRTGDNTGSL
ncbi:Ubiquitin carboxyl-terminal hydrolase 10 [Malassezia nana]|uniref:Ubiquitin carboxyl-terminal hydrolase 10 n=1 Tax=Malassezia nana TaxID=180528 RepID=A0AAF0J2A9_9BASI|nr:Ubiquitin carboxyl-terminal hydrolase 10 [Malassezia nana]